MVVVTEVEVIFGTVFVVIVVTTDEFTLVIVTFCSGDISSYIVRN